MMFTDAVCSAKSKTFVHVEPDSRQMKTLPSYPAEARMLPYFGCAQETHHTAPSCLEGLVLERGRGVGVGREQTPSVSRSAGANRLLLRRS